MPTYYSFPDNSAVAKATSAEIRPGIRSTQSFSRLEPSPAPSLSLKQSDPDHPSGAASASSSPEASDDEDARPEIPIPLPAGFDDLPPDIIAFCDKFVDSLTQRTYPTRVTGEHLSEIFQDFYLSAFDLVRSYISSQYLALSSKKKKVNAAGPETQMLSISEIAQKKKDRKLLGAKRVAMEEAVERRVCESIYDKIWRHKSTDDEARDESLRSKTATLKVVGVTLEHLGVTGVKDEEMIDALVPAREALLQMSAMRTPIAKLDLLRQAHKSVVDALVSRNSDSSADRILPTLIFCLIHSPPEITVISDLFFIQRFRAKKAIDGEAAYCLTNLEAAVCFLETVDLATLKLEDDDESRKKKKKISESVTSTKTDNSEASSGGTVTTAPSVKIEKRTPSRGRRPVRELMLPERERSETPFIPADDPLSNLTDKLISAQIDHSLKVAEAAWEYEVSKTPSPRVTRFPDSVRNQMANTPPTSPLPPQQDTSSQRLRALSYLTNNPVVDVAGTVVSTADVGIKTIGNTLENSYKFLFGRMDEKKAQMPKTLEDARKLVEQPVTAAVTADGDTENSIDDLQKIIGPLAPPGGATLPLVSPPPPPLPERPGKQQQKHSHPPPTAAVQPTPLPPQGMTPVTAFAAIGTSITRMAGVNVMRPFTRSSSNVSLEKEREKASSAAGTAGKRSRAQSIQETELKSPPVNDLLTTFPDLASPLMKLSHSNENAPAIPISRESADDGSGVLALVNEKFLTVQDAGDLRLRDVEELLRDYKRLAEFVRGVQLGAPSA